MEIIKHGKFQKEYRFKAKCVVCGCKVRYSNDEIKVQPRKQDVITSTSKNYTVGYIMCPDCNNNIYVSDMY